jgi:hypothetical protein
MAIKEYLKGIYLEISQCKQSLEVKYLYWLCPRMVKKLSRGTSG